MAAAAVALVPLIIWVAGEERGGAVVLVFPVLVAALALTDGGVARPLSARWVVAGGRISFALYLVHMGVFEACWTVLAVLPGLGGSPPLHAAVLVLPVPAAWVLWRWVEEPARRAAAASVGPGGIPCPPRRDPRRASGWLRTPPVLVHH